MNILFAFNGSQAESLQTSINPLAIRVQVGTIGTDPEITTVLIAEPADAKNDGIYCLAGQHGQVGQVGHSEVDVKPVKSPIKLLGNLIAPVAITFTKRHVALDSLNYSESDVFDGAEYRKNIALNTKLVNCESCVHFDFLTTPISQSCMINAAKPHKRYPKKMFQDIVAECAKREVNKLLGDNNIQNEDWNHKTDYPF